MDLSFGNYNDPTRNGSSFSAQGIGALSVGQPAQAPTMDANPVVSGATNTATVLDGSANSGIKAGGNFWSKEGGAGMVLGGVQVLGNLWNAYNQNKIAKEQMSFARDQWNTNLTNQTKTYNTALEDRIRGRYAKGTRSEEQLSGEIDRHRL